MVLSEISSFSPGHVNPVITNNSTEGDRCLYHEIIPSLEPIPQGFAEYPRECARSIGPDGMNSLVEKQSVCEVELKLLKSENLFYAVLTAILPTLCREQISRAVLEASLKANRCTSRKCSFLHNQHNIVIYLKRSKIHKYY